MKEFEQQLKESLYLHTPLKADRSRSLETTDLNKKVLSEASLWDGKGLDRWRFDGEGEAQVQDGTLVLKTGSRSDHWPEVEARAMNAGQGDYATFGSYEAKLDVKGMDLSRYNRMYFQIRPLCHGLHSPIIRAAFVNNGTVKIPDVYSREGFNAINLRNFEWNTCTWEIGSIAHDKVEEVSFIVHRYGQEVSGGKELRFELRDIRFQQAEDPNVVYGWQCREETAAYSTTGYWRGGVKTAVANTKAERFSIEDSAGKTVLEGPVRQVKGYHGEFQVLDFTELQTEGLYRIRMGGYLSGEFRIADNILENAVWKLVNFLFSERCGCPVPGKHGTCHGDIVARYNGLSMVFQGGWHDAADVSQETVQTAETAHALMSVARSVRDQSPLLSARLMEEANWGLDLVLRTRLGDGYRASGSAIRRWTDGLIGNMDDCNAYVQNNSFLNFQIAAVEADMSLAFAEFDSALSWKCLDAAKEDFAFAEERFAIMGVEPLYLMEHATGSALSQYYAAACWAASLLCKAAGKEYANTAERWADKLLACQETGDSLPMKGFFYRDEEKSQIVHSAHQSREHLFAQALTAACEALPDSLQRFRWEKAMDLYGGYLKGLMQYTAPYGMIPAGLYEMRELENKEAFRRVHEDRVVFEEELKNYKEQLEKSVALGSGCYVKSFPVWFSFRGNSGVLLSMGKAASILGRYFGDKELLEIAREQLYWTLGKNPFSQSLMYGEGDRYGQQYAALLGETVGEMTVGVQTLANEDLPYWPPANIATYREVWTTPPTRWLWIAADLMAESL